MGLALSGGPSRSVAMRSRQADHVIIADGRERFQRHVTAALDGPFLGLLHQDRADQPVNRYARLTPRRCPILPLLVALDISVLLRLPGLDVLDGDTLFLCPVSERLADVFGVIVDPNGAGFPAPFDVEEDQEAVRGTVSTTTGSCSARDSSTRRCCRRAVSRYATGSRRNRSNRNPKQSVASRSPPGLGVLWGENRINSDNLDDFKGEWRTRSDSNARPPDS